MKTTEPIIHIDEGKCSEAADKVVSPRSMDGLCVAKKVRPWTFFARQPKNAVFVCLRIYAFLQKPQIRRAIHGAVVPTIHKLAKRPKVALAVSNNDPAGTPGLSPGIARFRRPPADEARDGFGSNLSAAAAG